MQFEKKKITQKLKVFSENLINYLDIVCVYFLIC